MGNGCIPDPAPVIMAVLPPTLKGTGAGEGVAMVDFFQSTSHEQVDETSLLK